VTLTKAEVKALVDMGIIRDIQKRMSDLYIQGGESGVPALEQRKIRRLEKTLEMALNKFAIHAND
jgi:hypothetical protein